MECIGLKRSALERHGRSRLEWSEKTEWSLDLDEFGRIEMDWNGVYWDGMDRAGSGLVGTKWIGPDRNGLGRIGANYRCYLILSHPHFFFSFLVYLLRPSFLVSHSQLCSVTRVAVCGCPDGGHAKLKNAKETKARKDSNCLFVAKMAACSRS